MIGDDDDCCCGDDLGVVGSCRMGEKCYYGVMWGWG